MGRGGEEELLLPGAGGQKGDFEAGGQRRVGERKLAKFGGERVAGGRRKEEGGSPGWGVEVWVSGGGSRLPCAGARSSAASSGSSRAGGGAEPMAGGVQHHGQLRAAGTAAP